MAALGGYSRALPDLVIKLLPVRATNYIKNITITLINLFLNKDNPLQPFNLSWLKGDML
jgi:hypothetical protein